MELSQESSNQYFKAKRDQYLIEIRKSKNNDIIFAKRVKLSAILYGGQSHEQPNSSQEQDTAIEIIKPVYSVQNDLNDNASGFQEALQASDFEQATKYAEKIRMIVSVDDPPLDELRNCGVVPFFLNLLENEYFEYTDLILECSWVITNATSGDKKYVDALIELGVVPKFLNLLLHKNVDVRDNALWGLANIAGENMTYRDQMLEMRVTDSLDYLLENQDDYVLTHNFMTQLSWFISIMLRGPRYPDISQVKPFIKFMRMLLLNYEDEKTLNQTLNAFNYLASAGSNQIDEILNLDVVERLIELAYTKNETKTLERILRLFGYLALEAPDQVKRLIDSQVHEVIILFLDNSQTSLKKEAALTLSNFMASDSYAIEEIFNYQDGRVLDRLFYMIDNEIFEVSKECTYCLVNACSTGEIHHIIELVKRGIIELLISTLKENTEVKLLVNCISGLDSIYDSYKNKESMFETDPNEIAREIFELGGYQVFDDLQKHQHNDVYEALSELIKNHFEVTEESIFEKKTILDSGNY